MVGDPTLAEFHKPVFEHVMIDIETMSLHPHRALVLSVGMLEFDPTPAERMLLGASHQLVLDIPSQFAIGRHVSKGTQKFWADQPAEARSHWVNGTPRSVLSALKDIRDFCTDRVGVWANGTQFDLSNLKGLAEDFGYEPDLWHYQCPRDMRTFVKETPVIRAISDVGDFGSTIVPHEPVSDCIVQAHAVWSHWQKD